ncbi:cation transporter [Polaribacter sp. MSW13]|uniref:Cation transporter n=1 Tax=Polaribacter marinus TaxID=2916838 RepID=A0A9X2AKA0_9FLAO|nr:heavy metal-associated domain-containing protein [Polaribacter marinus]MCI2229303.1 cation transporter [Polaribacter marinus]
MKIQKLIFSVVVVCFVLTGCKKEVKKESLAVNKQNVSLAISGMTCEIGCAKTIQSKLSKKEGVLGAKVIFTDSIANIEFDANTTSKEDLIAFVNGIAGGDLYTASETSKKVSNKTSKTHTCTEDCKEKCDTKNGKKECKEDCKMDCCADKTEKKTK